MTRHSALIRTCDVDQFARDFAELTVPALRAEHVKLASPVRSGPPIIVGVLSLAGRTATLRAAVRGRLLSA
jgi:hypothetical protein